jgi:hypothetical protein
MAVCHSNVQENRMTDPQAVADAIRQALTAKLGDHLLALYLFGSAACDAYVPGRSDIDLLLVVDPALPLFGVRDGFRPLWLQHADALGHGPWVATPDDLALHLALFPSLHRNLLAGARCLQGQPLLADLLAPPAPDPVEQVAYIAARAITRTGALTASTLPPEDGARLTRLLERLARRVSAAESSQLLTPMESLTVIHARLRELAVAMPQFEWLGEAPGGEAPGLLPGCLAFYQWEQYLIAVLERVDEETLAGVDWEEVGLAAQDAHSRFALATPWQFRLAASQVWADSLYFNGFEHMWGADILGDLAIDQTVLLRQLARVGSEQRVEKLPSIYLTIEDAAISKLIHDTQNGLLNAGLRAELFARFSGRPLELPDWHPPGREVPQAERVVAAWERWRQVTVYFADLWRQTVC